MSEQQQEPDILITYPIERLLAKPQVMNFVEAISGIPAEVLLECFYTLFESCLDEQRDEFEAVFAQFVAEEDGFTLRFDTGETLNMKEVKQGTFRSNEEINTSFDVNRLLMEQLRQSLPEDWKGDFGLENIPSPSNNFLLSGEEDCFRGTVYKLSSPEERMGFSVKYLGEDHYEIDVFPEG